MKGINPNDKDLGNWTPVHIASKSHNKKTLMWMLSLNTELARKNLPTFDFMSLGGTKSWSPLHVASYTGCFSVIQELIENAKCDVFSRSLNNKLPRQVARNSVVAKLFRKIERNIAY